MKREITVILFALLCVSPAISDVPAEYKPNAEATVLWYKQPAKVWSDAMPLGNGRLGAMVFGDPEKERILLNEETVWTGGPYNPTNIEGAKHIQEIRDLVFKGNYAKAHWAFGRYLMGYPVEQQKYQPLGDLWLVFPGHKDVADYRRDLDMDTAVASVRYTHDGVVFRRETLVSSVDQVVAVRLTADKPGRISFRSQLTGYRNGAHSNYGSEQFRMDPIAPDTLQLAGHTSSYLGIEWKIKYHARAKFIVDGGSMAVDYNSLTVTDADAVTILIPAATNFVNYRDVSASEKERVMTALAGVAGKSYQQIKKDHIAAHRKLFRRVSINLGSSATSQLPTDQRCKAFVEGKADPQLASLYFQFARYLLIASSRPGTKAANLQGIWNEEVNPSWDSKYTTNINLEMNYWAAEVGNLEECVEPLIDMLCEITEPGAYTAKHSYGARGWVLHQNTDIWWATAPMDGVSWGTFATGGAWLCTHLWEHYLYNPDDKEYLKKVYPVLKGAALFFVDTLVEHPDKKVLVTCPSTSPENVPHRPGNIETFDEIIGDNITPNICAGPAMDTQILRDLFGYVIEAAKILEKDQRFRKELEEMRAKLAPTQIGQHGQIQEWFDDWDDPKDTHRHFSHLYGIYPSSQINIRTTPKLARAAGKSVTMRGDFGTGFSMAWKMNIWARLLDGNRAHKIFRHLIDKNNCTNMFTKCFSTPQVEGVFGAAAGLAEMLMQSYDGTIEVLPALPDAWPRGQVKGLRARGGYILDLEWDKGKLVTVTVRATINGTCRLKYRDKTVEFNVQKGKIYVFESNLL